MEARAIAKYIRMSPRKVRIVADMVRGKEVEDALNILHFCPKEAAEPIEKALRSAVSNMLNVEGASSKVSQENLFVKEIRVDEGYRLKRFRAASMGRASPIRKRSCHIKVVVAEFE